MGDKPMIPDPWNQFLQKKTNPIGLQEKPAHRPCQFRIYIVLLVAFFCILLITTTTVLHYEVLRLMSEKLPKLAIPARLKPLIVVFTAFSAHALEIVLYGVIPFFLASYQNVGALNGGAASLFKFVYFSAETYSSLGYGDLIPSGPLRLFAGVEALNGLLLIGWSASYIHLAMERFWNHRSGSPASDP